MEDLLGQRLIEFPTITEEEIQDRSKGDALSKTLVIGQSSWFIVQCITRRAQGLITTEIELATLAFAALNGFMYFFWWNKPLDVRTTVPVYLFDVPIPEKEAPDVGSNLFLPNITAEYRPMRSAGHYTNLIIGFILNILFRWPWKAIVTIFTRLGDMSDFESRHSLNSNQNQVHAFYALGASDKDNHYIVLMVSMIGIIFGSIHCAGWDFLFPTHAEAVIWQVASVVITGWPGVASIFAIGNILSEHTKTFWLDNIFNFLAGVSLVITLCGLPIYIIAHLFLLMEVLITLRNLPPGVFLEVQWTSFLPHI